MRQRAEVRGDARPVDTVPGRYPDGDEEVAPALLRSTAWPPALALRELLAGPPQRQRVAAQLLTLQRSAGNRATRQLLRVASGKRKAQFQEVRFITEPEYGSSETKAGGTWVKVRLGPTASNPTNRGKSPQPGACTAVNSLLAHQTGGYTWIKGHLLNDNLGGPGESYNLTPLTKDANTDHLNKIEARVKEAIDWSGGRAQYHRNDSWWYGVYYEVKVVDHTWTEPTLPAYVKAVGHHLECQARWIRQEKTDPNNVEKLANRPHTEAPELPGGTVTVNCVQPPP